jgi:predicted DNA-binding ribbon-helix-helix protein
VYLDVLVKIARGRGLLAYILIEEKIAQERNWTVQVWMAEIRDSAQRKTNMTDLQGSKNRRLGI